jgi:hypothetical protein
MSNGKRKSLGDSKVGKTGHSGSKRIRESQEGDLSNESPGKTGKNNHSGLKRTQSAGGEKSVLLQKKYEREMGSKEIELTRRASDTMGYEMIYKEWVEVIV